VRINSETKKISLKLPSDDVFIHGCFTNAAKDLYKDPFVYHDEMSEYERDVILTRRFITCIEATVKDMIPIQEILKTYISHKNEGIDIENKPVDEDEIEDPDVEEEVSVPSEEEEPVAPQPPPPEVPAEPAVPEEVRNINTGEGAPPPPVHPEEEDDVLFPDAK
jgi:hypothetical protein